MYYLNNICFLCLVYNKNTKPMENNYLKMREEFQYFIPEHIFHNSETSKYVCNNCIESLSKINAFRERCFKNIALFKEYEQNLTQYPGSHKYLTIDLTNVNAEINSDVEIKVEVFDDDDSKIQNDIKINKTCKVTENEEKIGEKPNSIREVTNEIYKTKDFDTPTEYQTGEISNNIEIHEVFIKVEDEIENNYLNHEINEEFVVKEENEQENFSEIHNVVQQEPFCNQNELNDTANINDSNTAVIKGTQNQELSQNIEMIKCEMYYNKEANRMDTLKSPKLTRSTKKQYVCDVCQKKFNRIGLLNIHKFVHTGEKPFVCDVCQKEFNRVDHLRRHKLTHTDDRQYSCDVCQKEFTRIDHLRRHKLTHSDDKQYCCDVCQKTFVFLDSLRKHKLNHSNEKPYVCNVCQKEFDRKADLKRHKLINSCGAAMTELENV